MPFNFPVKPEAECSLRNVRVGPEQVGEARIRWLTNCTMFLKNWALYTALIMLLAGSCFQAEHLSSYSVFLGFVLLFHVQWIFLDISEIFNFRYFIPLSLCVFLSLSHQMSQITIGKNTFTSQARWYTSITNHLRSRGRRMASSRPSWATLDFIKKKKRPTVITRQDKRQPWTSTLESL